ncbi:unnamed protein product [Ilex paraguariensis]|uniref:Uncharacterized protein n=1 Tax=Ilex paraguariensis TaxID=185542 RepID=A0ABC8UE25_9AQUA
MGNCWPKPVDSLPSAAKLSNPIHNDAKPLKPFKNNSNSNSGQKSLSPPCDDTGGGVEEVPPSGRIVTPNLKMFTYAELRSATRNFRPDTMLGEGGFGRVFKGWIDGKTYAPSKVGIGIPVAVKKSSPDSPQGLKEWQVS